MPVSLRAASATLAQLCLLSRRSVDEARDAALGAAAAEFAALPSAAPPSEHKARWSAGAATQCVLNALRRRCLALSVSVAAPVWRPGALGTLWAVEDKAAAAASEVRSAAAVASAAAPASPRATGGALRMSRLRVASALVRGGVLLAAVEVVEAVVACACASDRRDTGRPAPPPQPEQEQQQPPSLQPPQLGQHWGRRKRGGGGVAQAERLQGTLDAALDALDVAAAVARVLGPQLAGWWL